MQYTTIFTSHDRTEVSIIKHLFEEHNIDFNVLGETTNDAAGIAGSGIHGMRVQVPEDQIDKAKAVLLESGFLGDWKKDKGRRRKRSRVSKWVLIFLAALVLILIAFLVMWFMNPG